MALSSSVSTAADDNKKKNLHKKASAQNETLDKSIDNVFQFNNTAETTLRSNMSLDLFITEVDRQCRRVCLYCLGFWFCLTAVSYIIGFRSGRLERLTGVECEAPTAACVLVGFSCLLTLMPLCYGKKGRRAMSGVLYIALVVQSIAFLTDLMLATLPVPVMVDTVMGTRVFLLRWTEWAPLAFLMSFIIETCQLYEDESPSTQRCDRSETSPLLRRERSKGNDTKASEIRNMSNIPYRIGLSQSSSAFCGWLFPFCPGPLSWTLLVILSTSLFLVLHYRLFVRYKSYRKMTVGESIAEREIYNWSRLSLGLMITCCALWTSLVLAFFTYTIGPILLPNNKFLHTPGLNMVCECVIDVLFKTFYMLTIVDVHDSIFDKGARAERRLEELRLMMGVVWENSSDVIGISVRNASGDVTTLLSPTFLRKFVYKSGVDIVGGRDEKGDHATGIAFELDSNFFDSHANIAATQTVTPSNFYRVDFSDVRSTRDLHLGSEAIEAIKEPITSMGELVIRAWLGKENETMLMHDLIQKEQYLRHSVRCEANVTRMEKNALVIVVRDISERFRRFEAEKKVISETTARRKDAAANRFTRHEVKNGLLAAIGLCDGLRETQHNEALTSSTGIGMANEDSGTHRFLYELDKTLHEILDTILAEAMARDVIHEVYEPKLERVNVPELLNSTMNRTATEASTKRFPLKTDPSKLPDVAIDPLLLKFIHRNAISNACKYGERGGVVVTEVNWNEKNGLMEMKVINLPGKKHEEILKLGDTASQIVFSPGKRLEIHSSVPGKASSHSSGDGAWIMYKCAKTLGGHCTLKFETDETVFEFRCPVTPYNEVMTTKSAHLADFKLPNNIYGIAIDDSKIQRKLLSRYFLYAGIPEDRIRILGGTASEIKAFGDWVVNFVDEHTDDYFLLIVDENLDIDEDEIATKQMTVSGSQSVSAIRQHLLLEQERRMLALIRSANDSANDVAIYNSRAHGYLPKSPIKPDNVVQELAPLWLSRFPQVHSDPKQEKTVPQLTEINEHEVKDLMFSTISSIDRLVKDKEKIKEQWPLLRERLHVLKGDLQTVERNDKVFTAIGMITAIRGQSLPPTDFVETWNSIRSIVTSD